jgi:tetratricopeptide (TPR) repeat protein
MPKFLDRMNVPLTAADAGAVSAFNEAVEALLSHAATTPAAIAALLETDPACTLGWSMKAIATALLARSELRPAVAEAAATAARLAAGAAPREARHAAAAVALARGEMRQAAAHLDQVLACHPEDALAAKFAHGIYFMLGDAAAMLASIRMATESAAEHPHRGYLLGCKAFALEETGQYRDAEANGRMAVAIQPRDAWGMHAVAHVLEMTGRAVEGAGWIERHADSAAHCNNFAGHVFWHLALFRLEQGDFAGVLDLYDRKIRSDRTDDFRDIANAASLLARLELEGVGVGDRWSEIADLAEARLADGSLVFADLHYCLALVGAGRAQVARRLATGMCANNGRGPDQRPIAEGVGASVAEALAARAEGRHADAAEFLLGARPKLVMVGGSHAQRDIFEQLTIDSALRAGRLADARGLLRQRLAGRRANRFAESRLAHVDRLPITGGALRDIAVAALPAR